MEYCRAVLLVAKTEQHRREGQGGARGDDIALIFFSWIWTLSLADTSRCVSCYSFASSPARLQHHWLYSAHTCELVKTNFVYLLECLLVLRIFQRNVQNMLCALHIDFMLIQHTFVDRYRCVYKCDINFCVLQSLYLHLFPWVYVFDIAVALFIYLFFCVKNRLNALISHPWLFGSLLWTKVLSAFAFFLTQKWLHQGTPLATVYFEVKLVATVKRAETFEWYENINTG